MKRFITAAIAVTILVMTSACSTVEDPVSTTGGGKNTGMIQSPEKITFDDTWTMTLAHPCTGEIISGEVVDKWTITIHNKSNGDRVLRYHLNSKGVLVGAETGSKYQFKDDIVVREENVNYSCPWSSQIVLKRRVTGSGNNNFNLTLTGKALVDCDWKFIVQRDDYKAECSND